MRTKNERVTELLIAWEEQQCRGSGVSPESLCGDCPDLLPALRERINALESMASILRQTAGAENSGTQGPHFSQNSFLVDLKPGTALRGYVLIERIGRGGFSVVWKARGPSGFPVALKFVPMEGQTGKAEKRALKVMVNSRHPNLLSIFGAWGKRNTIIIAMELADRTLQDRFCEARLQGQAGIPRDELLEYMGQAAQALDYLNMPNARLGNPGGVAHRDIKPHNLLLFGGGVKVGDLGLVRCLHGRSTGHTGSMTVAYAPPEFFDGRTTRWSDQYSLAVTYCLLRGGCLPFEGSPFQMMRGHLDQLPNLDMIPEIERSAVVRALAKKPEQRWATCREFVNSLMHPFLDSQQLDANHQIIASQKSVAIPCKSNYDQKANSPVLVPADPSHLRIGFRRTLPIMFIGVTLALISGWVAAELFPTDRTLFDTSNSSISISSRREQIPHSQTR